MNGRATSAIAVLGLSAIVAWPAYAAVPTAEDFAACNMKAAEQAASDSASASPRELPRDATQLPPDAKTRPGDAQTAPSPAGKAGAGTVMKDPTGNTVSSDKDPQVEGMAADRANDTQYVAAYRACMRQHGF